MKKSVGFEIKNLNKNIEQCVTLELKEKCGIIISQVQSKVIHYLVDNFKKGNVVYQKDIEKELNIKRSTVSGIIDTMEKNEIIKRELSDDDSRVKVIKLTDKSTLIANEIRKETLKFDKSLIKGVTIDELDNFFNVIDKINENIKMRRK